jgi:hypothetical protein
MMTASLRATLQERFSCEGLISLKKHKEFFASFAP